MIMVHNNFGLLCKWEKKDLDQVISSAQLLTVILKNNRFCMLIAGKPVSASEWYKTKSLHFDTVESCLNGFHKPVKLHMVWFILSRLNSVPHGRSLKAVRTFLYRQELDVSLTWDSNPWHKKSHKTSSSYYLFCWLLAFWPMLSGS